MADKQIILKPSFLGILGEFFKRLILFLIAFFIFRSLNSYRKVVYERSGFDSLREALLGSGDSFEFEIEKIIYLFVLLGVIIILITSIYFMLKFFVKLLTVFYGLFGGTYVDFSTGRILAKKYEFPFIKSVVESKFEEIIEVRVDQNIIDQLLGTGSITIEYMVTSSLDSQIKEVNFKYFSNPSSKKRALLNTLKDLN